MVLELGGEVTKEGGALLCNQSPGEMSSWVSGRESWQGTGPGGLLETKDERIKLPISPLSRLSDMTGVPVLVFSSKQQQEGTWQEGAGQQGVGERGKCAAVGQGGRD